MAHVWEVVARSAAAFVIMMVIARILGKSTIAQMTYHDFVAAITLGAITANLAFNVKMNLWELLAALVTFSFIAFILMVISLRSRPLRKWISGQPTIVIQDGKILENNMKKLKITLDTLNQELREKNIFDIEEVQYAILELNGKVSVLRKPDYLPVVHKDLNILSKVKQAFPIELIMDGRWIEDNLQQNSIDKQWLLSQIKMKGKSVHEISYAVMTSNNQLFFDYYEDRIGHPVDKE
ncbi:DUF421 domain-containing protein [Paenibacillus spongiae]|uniref:DUF421 domain-containing protein n=1 Tax=Paenibacillus spongiae TaxID=2909671 RepID=A0ABY5SGA8_9BACL|nr:DUF421 domain-containing protein [Paenibacillus spongiae]UVI33021.1 DUF421 domain-containing protein [Paenibacillus spongiae]